MTHTETITAIVRLQNRLLDHTGHVVRGTPRHTAHEIVDDINRLRRSINWKALDMTGRYRRQVTK